MTGSDGAVVSRRGLIRRGALAASAVVLTACSVPDRRAAPSLNLVGIITADLNRSLRFYRRLGLDVPVSVDGESYRLDYGDGHVLFWETHAAIRAFDPAWVPSTQGDRRVVVEFEFGDKAAVDAAYRRLVAAEAPIRLAPFDLGSRVRYAIVEDPDGNQVSLRHAEGP